MRNVFLLGRISIGEKVLMKFESGSSRLQNGAVKGNELQNPLRSWRDRIGLVLVGGMLPLGLFCLLTGMFWIGDHGLYSKLFYWTVALPALLLIPIRRGNVRNILRSPVFVAYLPFACYMALTVFWSASDDSAVDLIKRPLFVLLLFYAVFEFGSRRFDLLVTTIRWSAICSVLAAIYTLVLFVVDGGNDRLAGYGALDNPLMVSHVFGFFLALWFGVYFAERKLSQPLVLFAILSLMALIVATGSRTPLLATAVTVVWLAMLSGTRKGVLVVCLLAAAGVAAWLFAPEILVQRGLSYRTDIWANALRQVGEKPWFGHGYDAPIWIQLADFPFPFHDPHNLTLSVLFAGGVVGGLLWLLLYLVALIDSWRLRSNKWVLVCSATVVYGLVSGMTEGGSFLSRPKEHWFLIWIPMALLSLATYRARTDEESI